MDGCIHSHSQALFKFHDKQTAMLVFFLIDKNKLRQNLEKTGVKFLMK